MEWQKQQQRPHSTIHGNRQYIGIHSLVRSRCTHYTHTHLTRRCAHFGSGEATKMYALSTLLCANGFKALAERMDRWNGCVVAAATQGNNRVYRVSVLYVKIDKRT